VRGLPRALALFDYALAAAALVLFVVALATGVGARSLWFLAAAAFWVAFGRFWARR
jgi:hypothetical protein